MSVIRPWDFSNPNETTLNKRNICVHSILLRHLGTKVNTLKVAPWSDASRRGRPFSNQRKVLFPINFLI